jgi:hypothetical protein
MDMVGTAMGGGVPPKNCEIGSASMNHRVWMLLVGMGVACGQDYKVSETSQTFVVSPDMVDLGIVAVDEAEDFTVTVTHTGGADIRLVAVEIINIEGDAIAEPVDGFPEIVAAGTSEDILFSFTPGHEGYNWGHITFKTDAGEDDERSVVVRGQAAVPVLKSWPGVIDFGPVYPGETEDELLTVVNEGTVEVTIESMMLDNEQFAGTSYLPMTIAPGGTADLAIAFAPIGSEEQFGDATLVTSSGLAFAGPEVRGNACSMASGTLYDEDGDGYSYCGSDCDDRNEDARPGGTEVCDAVDNDCDGIVDEGTECFDDDGDGQTEEEGDCNDGLDSVYLGAEEDLENGIDDDCDGAVDSGITDMDGDGYSVSGGDCNDFDSTTYPGASETADGTDNDCDDIVDEGTTAYDDDGDGYTEIGGDCDDTNPGIAPGLEEVADWLDNDCDDEVDEGTIHSDDDGDGFSELGGDCDDLNPRMHPGYPELAGDSIDNNCNGIVDEEVSL